MVVLSIGVSYRCVMHITVVYAAMYNVHVCGHPWQKMSSMSLMLLPMY